MEIKDYVHYMVVKVLATNFIILWSIHIFVMIEKSSYSRDIVKKTNIVKFNELMNSNDVEILNPLSNFLKIIIKLSTSVLPKPSTNLSLYIFFLPLPVIYVNYICIYM